MFLRSYNKSAVPDRPEIGHLTDRKTNGCTNFGVQSTLMKFGQYSRNVVYLLLRSETLALHQRMWDKWGCHCVVMDVRDLESLSNFTGVLYIAKKFLESLLFMRLWEMWFPDDPNVALQTFLCI